MLVHNGLVLEKTETNRLGISGYNILARVEAPVTAPRFTMENKIPWGIWMLAVRFMEWGFKEHHSEVLVQFFYDKDKKEWYTWAPPQSVSHLSVKTVKGEEYDKQRKTIGNAILLATLHHHSDLPAFQSGTDHKDEIEADGFHVTIGNLDKPPAQRSWHARSSFKKEMWECRAEDFLDPELINFPQLLVGSFGNPEIPEQWKTNVTKAPEFDLDQMDEEDWLVYNRQFFGNATSQTYSPKTYTLANTAKSPIANIRVEKLKRSLDHWIFQKNIQYPMDWLVSFFNVAPGTIPIPDGIPDKKMDEDESGRITSLIKTLHSRRNTDTIKWNEFVMMVAQLGFTYAPTRAEGEALYNGIKTFCVIEATKPRPILNPDGPKTIFEHHANPKPLRLPPQLETTGTPPAPGTGSGSGGGLGNERPESSVIGSGLEIPRVLGSRRGRLLRDL